MKNRYQINKTIRFGLTINDKKKNKTHTLLKGKIDSSLKSVKESLTETENKGEADFLKEISRLFNEIKTFSTQWGQVCHRTDQVAVTKDFYRVLTRKARFDGFWKTKNKQGIEQKQPQSQIIKLSSLRRKYQDHEIRSYITDYWQSIFQQQQQLIKQFEPLLLQYKTAVEKQDKAHRKPNLINFSKLFLSLSNVVNEILLPLKNYSICFPDLEKIDNENPQNKPLVELVTTTDFKGLSDKIANMKDYLNSNGGYTHYGRVTLNRFTAEQKPHDYKTEINKLIDDLKIIKLVRKLQNKSEEEIDQYLKDLDKKSIFNNKSESVIVRAQCFKYKPIPAFAKYGLASYIAEKVKFDETQVLKVLDSIGIPRSIGKDYADLKPSEQDNFDLNSYPLKVAFDYAWENLAKNLYSGKEKFPKKQCTDFLKNMFSCDVQEDPSFRLYADLLYIKENLATLEHEQNKPESPEHYIHKIKETFKKADGIPSSHNKHVKAIKSWIDKNDGEQRQEKKANKGDYKNYEKAKQQLGFLRGGLKNKIIVHLELTKEFKAISNTFGRKFADLRDKFREQNELNKISHFGIIIEDTNKDRYLLISSLMKDDKLLDEQQRKDAVNAILDKLSDSGAFTAYQVKSLTSKALKKIVTNVGGYKDFHESKKRKVFNSKTKKIDPEQSLEYIKDCLLNSSMAKKQNWQEFAWDFTDCKSYEDIENEIDTKSYILQTKKLSRDAVAGLINEGCLLMPIVNQDITSQAREDKNQFSRDWTSIFDNQKDFRLHPEFRVSYRTPTEGYPVNKRYGRLQFIAHFNCEVIPQSGSYVNRKQQLELFNDQDRQKEAIEQFNTKVFNTLKDDYVVVGIDRGLKQLATLCTLNKDGKIIGDFEIYRKDFDSENKQWRHTLAETRHILDLSNLRVETTVDGKKVIVDQSLTLVKAKRNTPGEAAVLENKQKIKLKQLSYIRKLQYAMQKKENEKKICSLADLEDVKFSAELKNLISAYGEEKAYADLTLDKFREMIVEFKNVVENGNDQKEKNRIIELDHADDLKRGAVANMIGVVNFILAKFDYKTYLSLENLCRAYGGSTDGLSGRYLPSTNQDPDVDFKEQQNLMLAGLGTYQFFEMQLLKKLFKVQQERDIYHFVPAFRSVDNYENIMKVKEKGKGKYVRKEFGVVHFVDPKNTSIQCPICENITTKGNDRIDRNHKGANIFKPNSYDSFPAT